MYLATNPSTLEICSAQQRWYAPMMSPMSSGSRRVESAVEPTRSQNITVSWRRSADAVTGAIGEAAANNGASRLVGALAVRGLPHSAQNLAFGRFAQPQIRQRGGSIR